MARWVHRSLNTSSCQFQSPFPLSLRSSDIRPYIHRVSIPARQQMSVRSNGRGFSCPLQSRMAPREGLTLVEEFVAVFLVNFVLEPFLYLYYLYLTARVASAFPRYLNRVAYIQCLDDTGS